MIRHADRIRLSDRERKTFALLVGVQGANPVSAAEHDALLRQAQAHFDDVVDHVQPHLGADGTDDSGVAEARLMAAVLQGMRLDS